MGIIAVAQYTIKSISESLTYDGSFDRGTELWSQSKTTYEAVTSTQVVKDSTSEYGGNVLSITGDKWIYAKDYIPLRKDRIYKLTFRAKQKTQPTNAADKNKAYAGFYLADMNKTAVSATGLSGGNLYFAASSKALTSSWQVFSGLASMTDTPKAGVTTLSSNAAYFKPMFIVNYSGGNGVALVDSLIYEDVTEAWQLEQDLNNKVDNDAESVFNALTDNGKVQGLYMENNKLYMNGEYIRARNLSVVNDNNIETLKVDSKGDVTLNVKSFTLQAGATTNVPTKTEVDNSINKIQVGVRNIARPTTSEWQEKESFENKANETWYPTKIYLDSLKVGDEVIYSVEVKWENMVYGASNTKNNIIVQGVGDVTAWNPALPTASTPLVGASGNYKFEKKFTITSEMKKNNTFDFGFRVDYVQSGTISWRCMLFSKGNKMFEWMQAPEDIEEALEEKVSSNELITTINSVTLDENGLKINANAINITGAVTFNSLGTDLSKNFIKESDTTVINGGSIKTGTLEVSRHVKAGGLSIYNEKEKVTTFSITPEGYVTMMGDISSYNFGSTSGWKIFANGDAIFNSGEFRSRVVLPGAGMTNEGSAKDSVRIYAGATSYAERDKAKFRVLESGKVIATEGEFGGTFTGKIEVGNIFIEDSAATKGKASIRIKDNTNTITYVDLTEDYCQIDTDFGIRNKFFVDKSEAKVNGILNLNDTVDITKNYMFFQTQNDKKYYFKFMPLGEITSDGVANTEDYFAFKSKKSNQGEDFVFTNTSDKNVHVKVKGDFEVDNTIRLGKVLIRKDSEGATISIV